jgi:hypothetical protein
MDEELLATLQKVAERVRQEEVTFGDASGLCHHCSKMLFDFLMAEGVPCGFIEGVFHSDEDAWRHYWIEVGDYIIDVTADQFNRYLPEETPMPPILICVKSSAPHHYPRS